MSIVVTERVPVPFQGQGSGVGKLTWTQQSIWQQMVWAGTSLPMTAVRELGPGAAIADFVDEFRFYLGRYQAMRTLLRFEPDGRALQVVHHSGIAEIEIYDAGNRDPAEVAAELDRHYGFTRFDYEREWPMRMALVRRDGILTHAVLAIAHHVADPDAAMAMFEDLRDRDPVTGQPPRPPGIQPLEQARLQATAAGRRQNEAALRYWEEQLRLIPPSMFRPSDGAASPSEDRYWYVEFASPALHLALRAVAVRLGVSTGPVLYAAFATALAQVTGVNPVATMITVNNRFRPGFANAAGHMIQHGLCTLDVSGTGFDELVLTTRRRLFIAQKYGYYVQAEVDALVERIAQERGITFDLRCLFNDRRGEDGPPVTVPPRGEGGAAMKASTVTWRKVEDLHQRLIFHANRDTGALTAQLQVDTAYLSRADVAALLQQMETLIWKSW